MVANQLTGFLCYNNTDLIRDGYIYPYLTKEHLPDDFNMDRLDNVRKGIYYSVESDDVGNIIKIIENRKQLPASKIKLEILFSKVLTNAITNPITPGFLASFGGLGGGTLATVGMGMLPMSIGGETPPGTTTIIYHICDAETKINKQINVTKEMLNGETKGIIELDQYPLSIFGIVKEYEEEIEEEKEVNGEKTTTKRKVKYGLNFTSEQLKVLGKFSSGAFEGIPVRDIQGATDSKGLFGGRASPELDINNILKGDQENLFIEIIKDERKLKFRADNAEASGHRSYPFVNGGLTETDITSKKIRIKTDGLKVGDILYATLSLASKRHIRQAMLHSGSVLQINVFSQMQTASSILYIYDYQMSTWFVPKITLDKNYKLTIHEYINIQREINDNNNRYKDKYETLEGWRLSETITDQYKVSDQVQYFWAADYRGILLINKNKEVIVFFPAQKIRDQEWFNNYLTGLDFINPTGPNGTYLQKDIEVKIENKINFEDLSGFLFDIGENANSLLFDKEKIHYYRPFGLALDKVSKYDINNYNSGIGFPCLDIFLNYIITAYNGHLSTFGSLDNLYKQKFSYIDAYFNGFLDVLDLSFSFFNYSKTRAIATQSCDEDVTIIPENYTCLTYNPSGGPGIFFSTFYIENQFLGWRPTGGTSNSYWEYETPYYCGEFTKNSRIYIEDMGGDSLSRYSFIYSDTIPIFPYTISLDNNILTDKSMLVFREENALNCTAYHTFREGVFENTLKYVEENKENSHKIEEFNHDKHKIIGYNKLFGEIPSYSNGFPVTSEISEICHKWIPDFWQSHNFLDGDYGLDFNDIIPSINLPKDKYLYDLYLEYDFSKGFGVVKLNDLDLHTSLYFTEDNMSISDITLSTNFYVNNIFGIKCQFYHGAKLELLGKIWSQINVTSLTGITVDKRLDQYKVDAGQSSVVYDGSGRALIFYNDQVSSNISVAISYDEGEKWSIYKDILRLAEDEIASLPFVINDNFGLMIHLFYVLNDSFIMYKKINTDWFNNNDLWINYIPPSSYNEESDDDNNDNINSSLYKYSDDGKKMRREPSYFVEGNINDTYFVDQIAINKKIDTKNTETGIVQHKRFEFKSDVSQFTNSFNGNAYTFYIDNKGTKRLFIINNNKLSIKMSSDFEQWNYIIQDVEIHKDIFDDIEKRGEIPEVKNIQIVRNYFDSDIIYILYFHKEMMFMRYFRSNLLEKIWKNQNNQIVSEDNEMKKELEVNRDSDNKPLFLVGILPQEIKDKQKEKIENQKNRVVDTSNLAIEIPYTSDMLDKFNQNFALDTDTQPFAFMNREGLIRVFYKDSMGILRGLIVNGYRNVYPQVLYDLNKEYT